MKNIIAYARLLRIENLAFIAIFQYVLRYCVIIPLLVRFGVTPVLSDFHFALVVVSSVILAASGNVINDYFDISIDSINRPERLVVGTHVDRRTALKIHVLLTLIGVGIGLYLSIIFRKEIYALLYIAIPILLWFYSTHLKKMMLVGNLVISLMVALTGYLVISFETTALVRSYGENIVDADGCNQVWFYSLIFCVFAFFTNLAREIIKDMEDMKGDEACGCHTLPIEMGLGYSKFITIAINVCIAAMVLTNYYAIELFRSAPYLDLFIYIFIMIPIIAMCVMVFRGKESKDFHRASRLSKVIMATGVLLVFVYRILIDYLS